MVECKNLFQCKGVDDLLRRPDACGGSYLKELCARVSDHLMMRSRLSSVICKDVGLLSSPDHTCVNAKYVGEWMCHMDKRMCV